MKFWMLTIWLIAGATQVLAAEGISNTGAEVRKEITFEDNVIEGLGKKALDRLENLGRGDTRGLNHLYHRKDNFRVEMKETMREAGVSASGGTQP